ncbi:carboxypeptidase regulatory-like domain-containing protein [Myxococcus sp. Y35]|uniref:carboxypeptidase regulatory-like domain-containing protein n=1 Tax=Pseudomyxococcus flavus TaxID=3115648 RepID=UPI003CEC60E3
MTTYVDDVCSGKCESEPRSMTLLIRALPGETEVASVTSNGDGFYEAALEPGSYRICTSFERCTDFSVGAGEVVRRDYEMSVGPGWSK